MAKTEYTLVSKRYHLFLLLLVSMLLLINWALPARGMAEGPVVNQIKVTDVTPKSFSVSWITSEPATADLYVYESDCLTMMVNTGFSMEFTGYDATGILKATVSALTPNTDYCFQTVTISKSSATWTIYPSQPSPVKTEKQIIPFKTLSTKTIPFFNDLLRAPNIYLPTPNEIQEGILVTLQVLDNKTTWPISILLNSDVNRNYFNMNNVYDANTSETINIIGTERVKVSENHGLSTCILERYRITPLNTERGGFRELEFCSGPEDMDCNNRVNILDILYVVKGVGKSQGEFCYNDDMDLNRDGKINKLDIEKIIGSFYETP